MQAIWRVVLALIVGLSVSAGVAAEEGEPAPAPAVKDAAAGAADAPPEADEDLEIIQDASGRPAAVDVVADAPAGPAPLIGREPEEDLRTVPGSGLSLSLEDIQLSRRPESLQEVVRGLPGVHVRDEVLAGVVPNIGIRGLNPDRSEKLLILEDGIPVGLAPYSVNAAYYVPPFERFSRMELLKGSGQILYGPHTVGGVLNLITPDIPCCPGGHLDLSVGSHGYFGAHVEYGAQHGPFGYWVSALHKTGDGTKEDSTFDIQSVAAKFRYHLGRRTHVTLKLDAYDSEIESTYLGLTQSMFDDRPLQNPADHDLLEVSWYGAHATVAHELNRCWNLQVDVYGSDATRNWNRQDFARNTGFAPPPANTEQIEGDTTVDGGALYMRSSFGSRDREFFKWGVQPTLRGTHRLFGREAEVQIGARYHFEKFINARHNRATRSAAPVTRNREVNRIDALSGFLHGKIQLTPRLGVSGGVRLETWDGERHFRRQNNLAVDFKEDTTFTEWIPGLGFTYQLPRRLTVFGGVHRGFAPPRITDAIDSSGTDLQLDPERSWNFELGLRGRPLPWLTFETAGFYMDFENQVVPANQSGGASTANTNAGQTEHLGVELALRADLLHAWRGGCHKGRCLPSLWFDASYTFVHTENTTSNGTFRGNELPYAPNHLVKLGLAWDDPRTNLSAGLVATWTDEQFTDQANTRAPSNDGLVGLLDDYWVVDATVRWKLPRTRLTAHASLRNLFDERYIASRAPSGIHVGAPRHFFVGLEMDL